MPDARAAAELAARASYGRLLSILAARTRDIAAAEDALADAFATALRVWPERGVPANPDGWLLTTARNRAANARRQDRTREAMTDEIERREADRKGDADGVGDDRLKLMFVCAHPAIDPASRTPLMLQTVLGLDAARIAAAFLVQPAAMGQRLVRVKAKIRDAGLRFALPDPGDLPDRMSDVLDAVYAAFVTGWDAVAGADDGAPGLTGEAIFLARLLVALMPGAPEAKGLLALMLFCDARRAARRDAGGAFVPLSLQDSRLWSRGEIIEAEGLLTEASRMGVFGRYQCEAAIQSVHAQRAVTGVLNHGALTTLYLMLAAHSPTVGVLVAQAGALVEAGRAGDALAALDRIGAARTDRVSALVGDAGACAGGAGPKRRRRRRDGSGAGPDAGHGRGVLSARPARRLGGPKLNGCQGAGVTPPVTAARKFSKNFSLSDRAVPAIRRLPSCASLPPTSAVAV